MRAKKYTKIPAPLLPALPPEPKRGPGSKYPTLRARPTTTAPSGGYNWGIRTPKALQQRFALAALQDGRTLGQELEWLLDLRERFEALAVPAHPLGRQPDLSGES